MGASINGLENLIRMPYGCGEQNMLNFAPNIYILQYLEATNQDNAAIQQKAKDFMKKGSYLCIIHALYALVVDVQDTSASSTTSARTDPSAPSEILTMRAARG
jgi:hypothetical protein